MSQVFKMFGSKIYVDKATNLDFFFLLNTSLECFRSSNGFSSWNRLWRSFILVSHIRVNLLSFSRRLSGMYVCDDEGYSESGILNSIKKQLLSLSLKRISLQLCCESKAKFQVSHKLHERNAIHIHQHLWRNYKCWIWRK